MALKDKDPAAPTNYEPLITVGGMPGWPRRPLAEQFDFDAGRRVPSTTAVKGEDEQAVNFESIWCSGRRRRVRHAATVTAVATALSSTT